MNLLKIFNNKKIVILACLVFVVILGFFGIYESFKTDSEPAEPTSPYIKTPDSSTRQDVPPSDFAVDIEETAKGDVAFNVALKESLEKYPWMNDLPIRGDGYIIFYDYKLEKFRLGLYISETASQEEKDELIDAALEELDYLDVPTDESNYYIKYYSK